MSLSPQLTYRDLISGKFTRQFEKYITDQFMFRDSWVLLKSDLERLRLRSENNGVFFGRDGYLLEYYRRPGTSLNTNIDRVNRFADLYPHIRTSLLLVPTSVAVYPDKLPLFASPYDQLLVLEMVKAGLNQGVDFIDIFDALYNHRNEYIYFRTDHHWTMRGAYYAYRDLAKHLGLTPYDFEDFTIEVITQDFWGTYAARANNRHLRSDAIELFVPRFPVSAEITFNDKPGTFPSLFFKEHLGTRDKYSYFLDGIHPLAQINTCVNNGQKLVVFKDSYAHVMIPFLANHYEEIHVIDLRFFNADINTYLTEHGIQDALFLFNVSSFSTDRSVINFK